MISKNIYILILEFFIFQICLVTDNLLLLIHLCDYIFLYCISLELHNSGSLSLNSCVLESTNCRSSHKILKLQQKERVLFTEGSVIQCLLKSEIDSNFLATLMLWMG